MHKIPTQKMLTDQKEWKIHNSNSWFFFRGWLGIASRYHPQEQQMLLNKNLLRWSSTNIKKWEWLNSLCLQKMIRRNLVVSGSFDAQRWICWTRGKHSLRRSSLRSGVRPKVFLCKKYPSKFSFSAGDDQLLEQTANHPHYLWHLLHRFYALWLHYYPWWYMLMLSIESKLTQS